MTNLEVWSALVGVVMPLVVSLVNQSSWPKGLGAVVSVATSLAAAGVTCWLHGDLNGNDYLGSVSVILSASFATYHLFWKPTGIAPKVESLTSLRPKVTSAQ